MGRPSSSPLGAPGRVRVKRERGLPVVELLPSGMDASIRSDVFARYGVLQIRTASTMSEISPSEREDGSLPDSMIRFGTPPLFIGNKMLAENRSC